MILLSYQVLLITICLAGFSASFDELRAVVQIFRHGQRAPMKFYKNDPYADLNKYFGGMSLGDLTNEGKRQHYALGKFTRSRYTNFLPISYNRSAFYAETTDVDRTHMSAQANIFGIFPAIGEQVWESSITWQPIPIHLTDPHIVAPMPACEVFENLQADVLKTKEFLELDKKNAALYQYLTRYSGDNVTSLLEAYLIFDCLKSEYDLGYKLPSWASEIYPYPLTNLAGYLYKSLTYTTQMKRFFTGSFLNEVITYFENMATDATHSQKYKMYSAHDANIAAILNCFGAFNPPFPPDFASSIWMELHYKDYAYYINVYYKGGNTLRRISINGCEFDCPLAEFRKLLGHVIVDVDTQKAECKALTASKH